MPENGDLGFKSSLGPEQRHHEARQELQTIDHPKSDYLISGLNPLGMKFSVGTGGYNVSIKHRNARRKKRAA